MRGVDKNNKGRDLCMIELRSKINRERNQRKWVQLIVELRKDKKEEHHRKDSK